VTYQLRNHIPLGAPATREPATGDEPYIRVSLGFTPLWFHDRLGVDFGERWHLDPEYRYRTLVKMKEHLHQAFSTVPYFMPGYDQAGVEPTCATISGVHGIMLVPMLYGLAPVYGEARWPDAKGGMHIPKEELVDLPPFDPARHPTVRQLLEQMDVIERKWGRIHGYLNYQGILNIATKVRGQEIFVDFFDDPGFVHSFFAHIADTIEKTSTLIQARQRRSGFQVNLLSMSNCVINMISPVQYQEFILPLDRQLSQKYERFGIHTCNWDATPYLEALRTIDKMGYLDTGMAADLPRIRRMFPDTRRAIMYGPVDLEHKSLEALEEDVQEIARDYAPCDIVMADVEATTPDDRVRDFLAIVERISRKAEHEAG
jgi:hypothetical protein